MRFLLLFVLACVFRTSTPAPAGKAPGSGRQFERKATNVLVILLDDVGTNAVRKYREVEDLPRTPTLDGLARDGVLFRNAYSAPVCSAARAALLTGRYARRTKLGDAISDKSADRLAHAEITLPEMLDRAPGRWANAALGKWHLAGQGAPGWKTDALDQGFDRFEGSPSNLGKPGPDGTPSSSYSDWDKLVDGELVRTDTYATIDTTNDAIGAIRTMKEPWLAWVSYNAAHDPFHAPPPRLVKEPAAPGASNAELFRKQVESVDTEIARILGQVDPEVLARTMIVVIGDNGTPPQVVPPPFNGRQAKFTLYEGGTNVPWIVSGAGVAGEARGQESEALVHVVDLFPTVARVAGVDLSTLTRGGKKVPIDGMALQPLLKDPAAAWSRDVLFTERFVPNGPGPYTEEQVAVRDRRWKYMEVRKAGQEPERYLFDLKGKVTDGENLLGAGPLDEKAAKAKARLVQALKGFERLGG